MNWLTEVVSQDRLDALLCTIRRTGGIITNSCPCADGYRVSYVRFDD